MTESILILAVLAQRFRVRLKEGQEVTLQTRITLRPKNGMMTILERRQPAAQADRGLREPAPQAAAC